MEQEALQKELTFKYYKASLGNFLTQKIPHASNFLPGGSFTVLKLIFLGRKTCSQEGNKTGFESPGDSVSCYCVVSTLPVAIPL